MCILKYNYSYNYLLLYIFIHLVICIIMMLLFGVVSYKVRPPRLVSYACLYTFRVVSPNKICFYRPVVLVAISAKSKLRGK